MGGTYNPKVKIDYCHGAIYKVHEIAYHRNGISGSPFYIVRFKSEVSDNMIGILFEEAGNCAVFDNDLLKDNIIAFMENSWRGDHYEYDLREAVKVWDVENWKE